MRAATALLPTALAHLRQGYRIGDVGQVHLSITPVVAVRAAVRVAVRGGSDGATLPCGPLSRYRGIATVGLTGDWRWVHLPHCTAPQSHKPTGPTIFHCTSSLLHHRLCGRTPGAKSRGVVFVAEHGVCLSYASSLWSISNLRRAR